MLVSSRETHKFLLWLFIVCEQINICETSPTKLFVFCSSQLPTLSPQAPMSVDQPEVNHRAVYTPEDHLFPPLSRHDRHPSAPLLHSMLTSGISNTTTPMHSPQSGNLLSPVDAKDVLMGGDLDAIGRARSSSVPSRAHLPPQISISSPDDLFCKQSCFL